jgi:hypothetical protein
LSFVQIIEAISFSFILLLFSSLALFFFSPFRDSVQKLRMIVHPIHFSECHWLELKCVQFRVFDLTDCDDDQHNDQIDKIMRSKSTNMANLQWRMGFGRNHQGYRAMLKLKRPMLANACSFQPQTWNSANDIECLASSSIRKQTNVNESRGKGVYHDRIFAIRKTFREGNFTESPEFWSGGNIFTCDNLSMNLLVSKRTGWAPRWQFAEILCWHESDVQIEASVRNNLWISLLIGIQNLEISSETVCIHLSGIDDVLRVVC